MTAGTHQSFDQIQRFDVDYADVTITQYVSRRTGLRISVADQKGPIVAGYLTVATEIHDDSGSPHTLEHLCFLGSKDYPYKGVLDQLANKAFAQGTNAWTAKDQTVYTVDTVGWDAFSKLLPVYLDHVLYPTLTDAGCFTEVHYIADTGEDAGVVYSEMQSYASDMRDLMDDRLHRLVYPEGSGYRYDTGGQLKALRVLTADRIREYHKEMYRPDNLSLVIAGTLDHHELLTIVDNFEQHNAQNVSHLAQHVKRPFIDSKPTPKIAKTIVETLEFPESDESVGAVTVAFLGPRIDDQLTSTALEVLLEYLCASKVAILQNVLVERERLCSDVEYDMQARTDILVTLTMSSVSTRQLAIAEQRLVQLITGTASSPFDMQYMRDCIARTQRTIRLNCEESQPYFTNSLIQDHVYGKRDGSDLRYVQTLDQFKVLHDWTETDWQKLMKTWFVDANHISLLGSPSQRLAKDWDEAETLRVQAQREKLGPEGLARLGKDLEDAKAQNERPIPDSLLQTFPTPDTSAVNFISTITALGGRAKTGQGPDNDIQRVIDADTSRSKLGYLHFEHVNSQFVDISIFINTRTIPVELKPLLALWLANIFASPITRNGQTIPYETVLQEIERDTVEYGAALSQLNEELIRVYIRVETKDYAAAVEWLRVVLFDGVLDAERLISSVTPILSDIPEQKREGDDMKTAVMQMMHLTRHSASRAASVMSEAIYLKRIKAMLKTSPETVIERLQTLARHVLTSENLVILVVANVHEITQPTYTWKTFFAHLDDSTPMRSVDKLSDTLTDVCKTPGKSCHVVPMATSTSNAAAAAKSIDSLTSVDFPALYLAIAYMNATEGPLYTAIRGEGLAYGMYFEQDLESGLVVYHVYKSPDAAKAMSATRRLLQHKIDPSTQLSKSELENAVGQVVIKLAFEAQTMGAAARNSFKYQVIKGVDKDFTRSLLDKVRRVDETEVKRVIERYLLPCFDPARSNVVCTCGAVMEKNMVKGFADAGYEPEVHKLEHYEDDYGLAPVDGEDDLGSDEDDEAESDEDSEMGFGDEESMSKL